MIPLVCEFCFYRASTTGALTKQAGAGNTVIPALLWRLLPWQTAAVRLLEQQRKYKEKRIKK